ncbi:MAG: carboxypeptidase regulatory-like domain-containing protein [Dehalococcoidia bacterium]
MNKFAKTALLIASFILGSLSVSEPAYTQSGDGEGTAHPQTGVIKGTVNARAARYKENTVVYIDHVPGNFAPPETHPVVDQQNLTFHPHVLVIVRGTTVDFKNSDTVRHNIFSPSPAADNMNLGTYGPGRVVPWTFNKIGEVVLLCNVHTEMFAWVIVRQNLYFSVTDRDGHFEIRDVPAGNYTLQVWNQKLSAEPQAITLRDGKYTHVSFDLVKKR